VKYAFIQTNCTQFSVAALCHRLNISRGGYYDWCARAPSLHSLRDAELTDHLVRIHKQHRQALGALKTWRVLNLQGIACGKHRVARLRKGVGIEARRKQRFRVMVEHHHVEPPVADLVQRRFAVAVPNRVWVGDMTTLRTREGWLHLAIVLDLYSRRLVGWAMDANQTAALPIAALRMAITQRRPDSGLICHTDQGAVYGAKPYLDLIKQHCFKRSMSRKGNCHDNAVAESFFSNLKNEVTHHTIYPTRREAKAAIFDYIELFYNRLRPHQTLDYQTPVDVEARYQKMLN
jgi:putative transposase